MDNESTHLLVITEFITPPTPQIQEETWPAELETLTDQTIDFSSMRMVAGRADLMSKAGIGQGLPVAKTWANMEGRTVLIERLQFHRVRNELNELPDFGASITNSPGDGVTNGSLTIPTRHFAQMPSPPANLSFSPPEKRAGVGPQSLPAKLEAPLAWILPPPPPQPEFAPAGPVKLRAALPEQNSFVMDYTLVSGSSFTFNCGSTYLVSQNTYLTSGSFFSGSFIKYSPFAGLYISSSYQYTANTSCSYYAPIFTSATDNDPTHGQIIPGQNGGNYGPALSVPCANMSSALANS